MSDRSNLNVTRRLMRMLKVSGLPRVGGAHTLRYVKVKLRDVHHTRKVENSHKWLGPLPDKANTVKKCDKGCG